MKTTLIGYARCSTDKQDLSAQRLALQNLGVAADRIYTDHGLTGTNRDRPGLDQALAAVRTGDTLVVPKLDRLARSVPDARAIAAQLDAKGVMLALGTSVYNPSDPMGKMFFNILATFAEFEADLIRLHTREGMAIALGPGNGHASENNASGMAKIQEVLKDVAETFRSSILLLHHTVKGTGDSDAGLHQDAARGSGAGTANCRWQTNMVLNERTDQLDHMGGQQLDTISYAVSKANYGQKPATKVLVRLTNGMLLGLSAFREWNLVAPGDGQACADNENAAPNDNDRASCPSLTIHQVTPTAPSIERARRSGTTVHSI